MNIEDEYSDVLQNLEEAIIAHYRQYTLNIQVPIVSEQRLLPSNLILAVSCGEQACSIRSRKKNTPMVLSKEFDILK